MGDHVSCFLVLVFFFFAFSVFWCVGLIDGLGVYVIWCLRLMTFWKVERTREGAQGVKHGHQEGGPKMAKIQIFCNHYF